MNRTDFLIIGAGIAGASVAAELSSEYSVCLLEAESRPGYHSTGRSAALFSEIYGNRVVRGLSRASRGRMFEPAADFAPGPLTVPRGVLYIATRAQVEELRTFAAQQDVRALTRELDASATRTLCPVLREGYAAAGLYEPTAADIDVHGLHQAYLRQLRKHGGVLITSARAESIRRSGENWVVHAGTEEFAAPILINAAGAWADQVAALASVPPARLRPLRRTAILVDAPDVHSISAWPLVISADESFYFKPDAGRLLLSPADETPMEPCDVQPDEWDIAVTVDRITTATDITVHRIRHRWAGLRTFAEDRTPVVGFDPSAPGFFWLAGQGGYGMQTAPALALVAAALACNRQIPPMIADCGVGAADLAPGRLRSTGYLDLTTVGLRIRAGSAASSA